MELYHVIKVKIGKNCPETVTKDIWHFSMASYFTVYLPGFSSVHMVTSDFFLVSIEEEDFMKLPFQTSKIKRRANVTSIFKTTSDTFRMF
jgi:NAD(P)H-nitrite reductase large subunit